MLHRIQTAISHIVPVEIDLMPNVVFCHSVLTRFMR
jgi:hypothetical protein